MTSVRASPVASRPITRAVRRSPCRVSRKSRRRRRRAFSSSASLRRATCCSRSRTRSRSVSFSSRLCIRSPRPCYVPLTVRVTAVLARWSGAITYRKNRPSGSLRPRSAPIRSASTPASARKSPELRTARFRRRKSNTSYAAGAAALDEAAAAAAGPVMGPDRSVDGDVLEERQFIQDLARSHDDGGERIVGQDHGQARLLAEKRVEIPEQRPATGQHDPLVDDVRRELGRRALETDTHGLDDLVDGLEQRVSDLLVRDLDGLRHTGHEVAALDLHGLELRAGIGRADGDLDQLGGPLADEQVVLPLDVLDDRL